MSSTTFGWINTLLALLGVAAVFGALNKMKVWQTRPCVMLATGLIGIGLAGQALGLLKAEWAYYADTALYGGITALLVASQRVHTWFLERWANPIATVISAVVGALLLVGLLGGCASARAQDLDRPTLVVALEKLDGNPVLSRAVMLAVPVPEGGHVGVILNKPTPITMAKLFPDHAPSALVKDPVYLGGPLFTDTIFALARSRVSPGVGSREALPGVWMIVNSDTMDAFIAKTPNAARYYAGLVAWRPGQLDEWVWAGAVMLRPLDPGKLFLPDASGLYEELAPSEKPRV